MSKLGKEGQNWHYRSCFKSLKDKKNGIVLVPYKMKMRKNVNCRGGAVETKMEEFRERRTSFSLEIRAIQPSAVFGTRRRTARYQI